MIGRSFPLSPFVMTMLLFSLLLLIPLITSAETADSADLGFTCDEKKCTFSLAIPQSAVSFVDVAFLEVEITALGQNVTDLKENEKLINDEEGIFNTDFDALYYDAQSNLTEMFDLSALLNDTANGFLAEASGKKTEATNLSDALKCMVNNGIPADCGKNVTNIPTTPTPDEPTGKTEKPVEPFTGSTTTEEPFTGTTTTPEPFTGTTTTEAPFTGTTVTEPEKTTTSGPDVTTQSTPEPAPQGTVTTQSPGTEGTEKTSPMDTTLTAEVATSTSTEPYSTTCGVAGSPAC